MAQRMFVLDTNCFVEASRRTEAAEELARFSARAAPFLYLSSVVAAELLAGAVDLGARRRLEERVLAPYRRRGRVWTPSAAAWEALGNTLAELARSEGLKASEPPRSFLFDILIAWSCREKGAVLVSANTRDLERIGRVFSFGFTEPYPDPGAWPVRAGR